MDEYSKKVKIKFDADTDSVKKAEFTIDQLGERVQKLMNFDSVNEKFEEKVKKFTGIMNDFVKANGVESQFALLDYREEVLEKIQSLNELGTKEALKEVAVLQEQIDALNEIAAIKEHDLAVEEKITSEKLSQEAAEKAAEAEMNAKLAKKEKEAEIESNRSAFTSEFIDSFDTKEFSPSKLIQTLGSFKFGLTAGLLAVGTYFLKELKSVFDEGAESAKDLLSANRLSSSQTRNTMFEWGTTRAGAYGVQAAQRIVNIGSQDDLRWSSGQEIKAFYRIQSEFANKYIELQQSGMFEKLLENQIAMNTLDEELAIEEAKFYAENEDYIRAWKEFTHTIKMYFTKFLGGFAKLFGFGRDDYSKASDANQADAVSYNSSQVTANKYLHMIVDNSFNNAAPGTQTTVETSMQNFQDAAFAALF